MTHDEIREWALEHGFERTQHGTLEQAYASTVVSIAMEGSRVRVTQRMGDAERKIVSTDARNAFVNEHGVLEGLGLSASFLAGCDRGPGSVPPGWMPQSYLDALGWRGNPAAAPADDRPHAHWAEFDESLEEASWNRLQAMARSGQVPSPDMPAARKLAELARSYGYGEADSHVANLGVEAPEDEDAERAARRESFDAYMDGPYWNHIDRSCFMLASAGGGRPNEADYFGGAEAIAQGMRDAYESGRAERLAMEEGASPSP